MNIGDQYWTWYKSPRTFKQVIQVTYKNDFIDRRRVKESRVYNTKKEADTALRRSSE